MGGQTFRDGSGTTGIVDFPSKEDMKYAIRKLDDSEFKNPLCAPAPPPPPRPPQAGLSGPPICRSRAWLAHMRAGAERSGAASSSGPC